MTATRRLYWEEPYRREFDATVIERLQLADRPAVVLDATCFYPTSGGQPHDAGTLNDVPVLEVQEDAERIVHLLAESLSHDSVHGVIDWPRRFDHMQQHTGQHILSQAFERELDADTVSFHLGSATSSIDLATPSLDSDALSRVEALANRIVFDNRPVLAQEYDRDQVASLSLRRAPQVLGAIRVVSIEGFDACACGGTHVRATGEVGGIHIRGCDPRRDTTRVEFLCGWRALRDYRCRDLICQATASRLSTGVSDLPEAVSRLLEAEQAARRKAEDLRTRLLDCELPHLASEVEQVGALRLLCRMLEGYDAGNMRYLASSLTQEPGIAVLLAVTEPSPRICFARSQDVDIDVAELLRETLAPYGGRGGGRPHVAQGGGIAASDLRQILADARQRLGSG